MRKLCVHIRCGSKDLLLLFVVRERQFIIKFHVGIRAMRDLKLCCGNAFAALKQNLPPPYIYILNSRALITQQVAASHLNLSVARFKCPSLLYAIKLEHTSVTQFCYKILENYEINFYNSHIKYMHHSSPRHLHLIWQGKKEKKITSDL